MSAGAWPGGRIASILPSAITRSAFTRPERLTGDWLLPAHWPYSGVRLAHFAGPASPLMLQPGRLALAESDRAAFERASQRLRMTSNRSLRQGIADGSVRPCDTVFVGQVAAGIFLWLPKWLPADYPLSPRQIAEEICDVVAYGLAVR